MQTLQSVSIMNINSLVVNCHKEMTSTREFHFVRILYRKYLIAFGLGVKDVHNSNLHH